MCSASVCACCLVLKCYIAIWNEIVNKLRILCKVKHSIAKNWKRNAFMKWQFFFNEAQVMISAWKYSRSNLFYSFYDLLKGFSKNFTCVSFAEPPKFGRRFLLLSGGDPLQGSLFSTISALSSAKGARAFLVTLSETKVRHIFLMIS